MVLLRDIFWFVVCKIVFNCTNLVLHDAICFWSLVTYSWDSGKPTIAAARADYRAVNYNCLFEIWDYVVYAVNLLAWSCAYSKANWT